ncbi:MAG: cysteine desulfurase [Lachnospiraceae bacterium]|nr:cysteine desulfurase [Lachnospiraceae bacterium]
MEAYLDNAATTQVYSEVCDVMRKVLLEDFGNPSSKHTKGLEAENYIKHGAEIIAEQLKCKPKEIVFTSGGTEANNMALFGAANANKRVGKHIITTVIEHASVLEPVNVLEKTGYDVTYLPVDTEGRVAVSELAKEIKEDTFLVSVMYVNNEVGSVQPVEEIGRYLKEKHPRILFHVDAIQAFGKYRIKPGKTGIDLMSVSGHKLHGPKGTGFLYVREGVKLSPVLFGGGQQRNMRSGTENVPGIAGLMTAVKKAYEEHEKKVEKLYALKKRLMEGLGQYEGITFHAVEKERMGETAPHILSVGFSGIKSEVLLHALAGKGVYVSSGSACSSNHPQLSGTLKAIGVKDELLDSTLRFSFSTFNTEEEVGLAVRAVGEVLPMLRKFQKR